MVHPGTNMQLDLNSFLMGFHIDNLREIEKLMDYKGVSIEVSRVMSPLKFLKDLFLTMLLR